MFSITRSRSQSRSRLQIKISGAGAAAKQAGSETLPECKDLSKLSDKRN